MLDLETLSAVLRSGSFEQAAARLGITPSAVSQRIKALEERIGSPLILRGTPCSATALGARLLHHADTVAALERQLFDEIGAPLPDSVPLRVAVTADSLATWVIPALVEVDGYLFDLVIDDQDHSAEWLRRGEVAGALTARTRPVQGCSALALGALRYVAVASPEYLEKWFPGGLTAEAAARAPMLQFNAKDALQHKWLSGNLGQRVTPPAHIIGSSNGFIDAAEAGLGWGMVPEAMADAALHERRLSRLAPAPMDVPVIWQTARATERATATLTRALKCAARDALVPI